MICNPLLYASKSIYKNCIKICWLYCALIKDIPDSCRGSMRTQRHTHRPGDDLAGLPSCWRSAGERQLQWNHNGCLIGGGNCDWRGEWLVLSGTQCLTVTLSLEMMWSWEWWLRQTSILSCQRIILSSGLASQVRITDLKLRPGLLFPPSPDCSTTTSAAAAGSWQGSLLQQIGSLNQLGSKYRL